MKKRMSRPKNNKYYIRKATGGLNGAVAGNPTIAGANVLANCVGYANGRFNESINDPELTGKVLAFHYQLVCNAENFIESAKNQGLKISKVPVVGGVMVWQKGRTLSGSDGAGHVAFVEEVYEDGSILTSESGWGSADWAFKNLRRTNSNGRWGQASAYTFRGCIINPVIDGKPVPIPKLIVDGIGGPSTVCAMQRFFGTTQDGVISGQTKAEKSSYPALTSVSFGKGGSTCIVKLQKWCGVDADGYLGTKTVKAWQKKLGVTADGVFGKESMKAWQKYLNSQLYKDDKTEEPKQETKQETKKEEQTTKKTDDLVIDVSYVQKSIDWTKVKAAGVKGAIIRCGYRGYGSGKLCQDDMFMSHIEGAHKAGLKIGVYFFTEGINATEGKEEAAFTLNLIKKAGIPLNYPVAIDTEHINASGVRANNLSKSKRTEVIKAFCEEIKRQGYEPMIYASLNWFSNNLDMSKLPYKVWCAQYYSKCQYKGEYVMWQYTSEGKINGISGVVDLNHCYIEGVQKEQKTATNDTKVTTTSTKAVTAVAALSIDELAKQVLEGKWGSGLDRKKNLEKAGYDYDKVQEKVNKLLADTVTVTRKDVIQGMVDFAYWVADQPLRYMYYHEQYGKECPLCHPHGGKNNGIQCIGLAAMVWHHGGGLPTTCNAHVIGQTPPKNTLVLYEAKTDAEALKLAQKKFGIKEIKVIRNKKGIPKSEWQAGDYCCMFVNGNVFKHAFIYIGNGKIVDASDRGTPDTNDIAVRSYKNYSAKVIIRYTGDGSGAKPFKREKYSGELPTTKLIKTNAEVIADAIRWAYWIAGDNSFHYGYTNKHGSKDSKDWDPNAHHNGCYFCGTNVDHGGRSKKGIKDFEKTYCCNPIVTAAYAHGGCDQAALKKCRNGDSYVEKSFKTSGNWKYLGKPKFSDLKKGDVLYWEKKDGCHYALYLGGGKLFEASGGDDNKKGSKKWNNSIHVRDIDSWGSFQGAFRYIGSVNATCCIYHGEVSKRVELLQSFLKWYGYDIAIDGLFGDGTLKAVKDFQKKSGITADGIVGPNTINAMKAARK